MSRRAIMNGFILIIVFISCLNAYGASGDGGDAAAFLKNGVGVRPISMARLSLQWQMMQVQDTGIPLDWQSLAIRS